MFAIREKKEMAKVVKKTIEKAEIVNGLCVSTVPACKTKTIYENSSQFSIENDLFTESEGVHFKDIGKTKGGNQPETRNPAFPAKRGKIIIVFHLFQTFLSRVETML